MPAFPSEAWFDAVREVYNSDETLHTGGGGAANTRAAFKIGDEHYLIVFEGFEVAETRAVDHAEACAEETDFVIEMAPDLWHGMIANIQEHGAAHDEFTINSIDLAQMRWFADHAAYFGVAVRDGDVAGFLIGMRPGTDYGSPNYRWFCSRYDDFGYIDRVAITKDARRLGLARAQDTGRIALDRGSLVQVQGDALRPALEHVRQDDLGGQVLLRTLLRGAHADIAGSDDGDLLGA